MVINTKMDDIQKIVKQQEVQIKALKQAVTQLHRMLGIVDKKSSRALDNARKVDQKVEDVSQKIQKIIRT